MPSPIKMTDEIREAEFAAIREKFEEEFKRAYDASDSKNFPNGDFSFSYKKHYTWSNVNERATLRITGNAFSKMMLMMLSTRLEIGWHGIIKRSKENVNEFILEDVLLYPQAVTAATIDADEKLYPMWAMTLPDEQFNHLRFHGHSHVEMATGPSGTDMNFRSDLLGQFKDGFYVFLIINKKLETNCQIYDLDENNLFMNNEIDIVVGDSSDADFVTAIEKQKDAMVVNRGYNPSSHYGGYGNGYGSGYGYGGNYGGRQYGANQGRPASIPPKSSADFRSDDEDEADEFLRRWGY